MTVAVALDKIEGSAGRKDAQGWVEVTRIALVTGLSGTSGQAQLEAAVIAAGMPAYGAVHPSLTGLYLNGIEPTAMGGGVVKVRLVYNRKDDQEEQAAVITVGSAMEQQSVNTDYEGTVMYVAAPAGAGGDDQIGTAAVGMPKTTMHFSRRETTCPALKSILYVGTVNSGGWIVESAAPPRVWLCTAITGSSNDGGTTYQVEYDFARSQKKRGPTGDVEAEVTWDAYTFWIDPNTGKPHKLTDDIDYSGTGAGWERWQVYPAMDFDALRLGGN